MLFRYSDYSVPLNPTALLSPRQSSVKRIRESIVTGGGPSSPDSRPRMRAAGTCNTTKATNERRKEHHRDLANRAACMPKGPKAGHIAPHTVLQKAYMVACSIGTGRDSLALPDPLVLESLSHGLLSCDVMLYQKEDRESVAKLLENVAKKGGKEAGHLEGVVFSCGELRGGEVGMRRVGWDVRDIPRSVSGEEKRRRERGTKEGKGKRKFLHVRSLGSVRSPKPLV